MESQTHNAQRIEGMAESSHSLEVSQAPPRYSRTHSATPTYGTQRQEPRSRSKAIKELRQLGAVDFFGTTDPAEVETWLKRTERVFTLMGSTEEDQFFYIVSLL